MRLDPKKIQKDESHSNPMIVAYSSSECPLPEKRPCFFIVVGPGTIDDPCPHFRDNCTDAVADIECSLDEDVKADQAP